jgi:hypothetical protein
VVVEVFVRLLEALVEVPVRTDEVMSVEFSGGIGRMLDDVVCGVLVSGELVVGGVHGSHAGDSVVVVDVLGLLVVVVGAVGRVVAACGTPVTEVAHPVTRIAAVAAARAPASAPRAAM